MIRDTSRHPIVTNEAINARGSLIVRSVGQTVCPLLTKVKDTRGLMVMLAEEPGIEERVLRLPAIKQEARADQ